MAFVTNREIIEVQIWMFVFGLLVMYQASVVGVQSMSGCAINERYRWQCQLRMLAYLQPVIQEFWYTESKTSKISHTPGSSLRQGQINTRKKQAIVSRSEVEISISIMLVSAEKSRTERWPSEANYCAAANPLLRLHIIVMVFSVLIRIHISIGQQLKVLFWHLMIFI
mgnify:FL=1